jgi:uncharacterized membrane protein YphA (DoxX/SURF4 family)
MMANTGTRAGTGFPSWPKYALRFTFGGIWLIDAVLKWLPGFRAGYMGMISGAGQGQPGWLGPWFRFWTNLQSPHPAFYAYLVAVLETLVALAVLFGVARKVSYLAAAGFSVVIWAAAEGFGGPYTSGASDIGTAIIYALVFMCLLTLSAYTGPDTYSVDHYLEKKISWWWKIAVFRNPAQHLVPVTTVPVTTVPVIPAAVIPAAVIPAAVIPAAVIPVPVTTVPVTTVPVTPDAAPAVNGKARPTAEPAGRR